MRILLVFLIAYVGVISAEKNFESDLSLDFMQIEWENFKVKYGNFKIISNNFFPFHFLAASVRKGIRERMGRWISHASIHGQQI